MNDVLDNSFSTLILEAHVKINFNSPKLFRVLMFD